MTFDMTIHIPEVLLVLTGVWGLLKAGTGLRDSVRDLTTAVTALKDELKDHEERIRGLEKAPRRRRGMPQ